jgi:hypothetical protein
MWVLVLLLLLWIEWLWYDHQLKVWLLGIPDANFILRWYRLSPPWRCAFTCTLNRLELSCRQHLASFRNFYALYIKIMYFISVRIKGQLWQKSVIVLHVFCCFVGTICVACALFLRSFVPIFLCSTTHRVSVPDSLAVEIEKKCQSIFPLQNVFIRKVKVLKKPKFDLLKLMEVHGENTEDTGAAVDKVAAENTVKSLKGAGGRL